VGKMYLSGYTVIPQPNGSLGAAFGFITLSPTNTGEPGNHNRVDARD